MNKVIINSPLGFTLIEGDELGISKISVTSNKEELSTIIPDALTTAVTQLEEYFLGKRTHFDFKLNPSGTEFQKKVW